jgi:F0F1-type ATP synthase assembly protein I
VTFRDYVAVVLGLNVGTFICNIVASAPIWMSLTSLVGIGVSLIGLLASKKK